MLMDDIVLYYTAGIVIKGVQVQVGHIIQYILHYHSNTIATQHNLVYVDLIYNNRLGEDD